MSSELQPNLVALNTIVYREVKRFTRIWPQTLLPPAITMVLYFVIFGNLIGRQIGDMGGFTYMEYIAPGHKASRSVKAASMSGFYEPPIQTL